MWGESRNGKWRFVISCIYFNSADTNYDDGVDDDDDDDDVQFQ